MVYLGGPDRRWGPPGPRESTCTILLWLSSAKARQERLLKRVSPAQSWYLPLLRSVGSFC